MTGVEIYSLVLETLTALATVGAVWVALWTILRKQPPFAIRSIQVMSNEVIRTGGMRGTGPDREITHFLRLTIENFRDTRMQIFNVQIEADHSKSKNNLHKMSDQFSEPNIFIPEKSIYDVQYEINGKSVTGTFSKANEITITVSTSFGSKTVTFPKEWRAQLYQATEEPWPFNSPSPFEAETLKRAV